MSSSADDDLLQILLVNLRNAAASYGEGSPSHESVRVMVIDHLKSMQARGIKTNLVSTPAGDLDGLSAMFSGLGVNKT